MTPIDESSSVSTTACYPSNCVERDGVYRPKVLQCLESCTRENISYFMKREPILADKLPMTEQFLFKVHT